MYAYTRSMRTVKIGELRNQLSAYLQYVRNGEEIVIRDRDKPIARILPFRQEEHDWKEKEARLVAEGILKMPVEEIDWDEFFSRPSANVPHDVAVQAVIDGR